MGYCVWLYGGLAEGKCNQTNTQQPSRGPTHPVVFSRRCVLFPPCAALDEGERAAHLHDSHNDRELGTKATTLPASKHRVSPCSSQGQHRECPHVPFHTRDGSFFRFLIHICVLITDLLFCECSQPSHVTITAFSLPNPNKSHCPFI